MFHDVIAHVCLSLNGNVLAEAYGLSAVEVSCSFISILAKSLGIPLRWLTDQLLLDQGTVERRIKDLDDVRVVALRQNADFVEEALQALAAAVEVLGPHNLDGDFFLGIKVQGQLNSISK